MSLSLVQGDDYQHPSLSIMPREVVINIFCQLPSFSDVFTLSAVCCRLRHLWLNNVNPVYKQIAPRSISCERAARRFLIDQDGPGLGSPMSAEDVVRMVRNAGVIAKAIVQFEREIVSRVRSRFGPNDHVVRCIGLILRCNSGWSFGGGVLWAGPPQTSSNPDLHRADALHSFLLLPLGSNET